TVGLERIVYALEPFELEIFHPRLQVEVVGGEEVAREVLGEPGRGDRLLFRLDARMGMEQEVRLVVDPELPGTSLPVREAGDRVTEQRAAGPEDVVGVMQGDGAEEQEITGHSRGHRWQLLLSLGRHHAG